MNYIILIHYRIILYIIDTIVVVVISLTVVLKIVDSIKESSSWENECAILLFLFCFLLLCLGRLSIILCSSNIKE